MVKGNGRSFTNQSNLVLDVMDAYIDGKITTEIACRNLMDLGYDQEEALEAVAQWDASE